KIPSQRPLDKYWIKNKAQKVAVKKMGAALRRLKATLNSHDLIFAIKNDFPMDDDEIDKWRTLLDKIAATELANVGSLNRYKRHAVKAAAEFLRQHDVPLTAARTG